MAIVLKDRVKVSATTTGTGTFTLGSAAVGFQSFAVIGDTNQTYYTIAMQPGALTGEFEVGIGTVTDTAGTFTLSRDTVLESSNAGSAVDFPAGTKDVFVTYPAERAIFTDAAGTAIIPATASVLGVVSGGTGITSFGTGIATFLGTPSSANLAAAVTDETGSGSLVFATSPTLVTPALGTPASGNLANCTFPTLNQNTTGTATNATNIAIAAETASASTFFVPYFSATTGNVAAKGTRLTVQPSTGNFTAVGTVTANSDDRLKTDWANLPADFLERLAGVKSGTYTRLDTGARQAGSSAQDWQKLLPEVVTIGDDEQTTLSLGYGNAALVAAVELAKVVVELKAELQSIKQQLKGD